VVEDETDPPTSGDPVLDEIVLDHWSSIKNYHWKRVIMDIINLRVYDGDIQEYKPNNISNEVWIRLKNFYENINVHTKIKVSAGTILEHKTSGELRYYHSSSNNAALFEDISVITSLEDLKHLFAKVCDVDLRNWASERRPSTSWKTRSITNLTFYIYKLNDTTRIGNEKNLDKHVLKNHHIACFVKHPKTGISYADNLCFFRCLTMFLNCKCANKCKCRAKQIGERSVLQTYNKFAFATNCSIRAQKFEGISFTDLLTIERIFNIRITVVDYQADQKVIVRWVTKRPGTKMMYLNINNQHFGYIKNIDLLTRNFLCKMCGTSFTRLHCLKIHKCLLEEDSRRVFVGGNWKPPDTIFEKVNRQFGKDIKKELYPFRIVYDVECLLKREGLVPSTTKMDIINKHELLSVSICSNVPGYTNARCLVRMENGSQEELTQRFVECIDKIAKKAGKIMLDKHHSLIKSLEDECKKFAQVESRYKSGRFSRGRKSDWEYVFDMF
jgi:hypothetical protein